MSAADTGRAQLARLTKAGLRVRHVRTCTDVDDAATARAVAAQAPRSRFAATLRPMLADLDGRDAAQGLAIPERGGEREPGPYDSVTGRAKRFR